VDHNRRTTLIRVWWGLVPISRSDRMMDICMYPQIEEVMNVSPNILTGRVYRFFYYGN